MGIEDTWKTVEMSMVIGRIWATFLEIKRARVAEGGDSSATSSSSSPSDTATGSTSDTSLSDFEAKCSVSDMPSKSPLVATPSSPLSDIEGTSGSTLPGGPAAASEVPVVEPEGTIY